MSELPDAEAAVKRLHNARRRAIEAEVDADYVLTAYLPAPRADAEHPPGAPTPTSILEDIAGDGWTAGLAVDNVKLQTYRLIWTPPEQSAAQTAYLGAQLRANDRGALIRLRAAMLIGGDVSAAARLLGVPLRSLQRWRQPGGLWAVRALLTGGAS